MVVNMRDAITDEVYYTWGDGVKIGILFVVVIACIIYAIGKFFGVFT